MPRIEIELTSSRADGSWTWRAAGARQPKGSLDGSILPGGVKVGDVLRADVEVELDGMTVTSVVPPKTKREDTSRLEIIGPPARERDVPGVTASPGVNLRGEGGDRPRRGGPGGGRDRVRDGGPGGPGGRGDRARTGGAPGGGGRPGGPGGPGARPGGPGGRPGGPGGAGGGRPGGPGGRPPGDRVAGGRPSSGPRSSERGGPPRERAPRPSAPAPPPRPRPKRLNPGRAHRDSVLASLPPEEQPVAEQILRGGVPAVRQALDDQNAAARASGAPEVKADALLALAERLAPRLRAAEWLDRAEAAIAQAEEVSLRDLRALVAGSDAVGRDESGRELTGRLRQVLDERSTKERDLWLAEVTEALEAGRVVRALRASGRPPEPGVRFPQPLAERLSEAANVALAPDVAPDRWAAVLEAVSASPVRRLVKPQGLPTEAPPELVQAARQAAERVPGLVPLVGAPEPSGRPAKRPGPAGAAGPARRRPPGPPRPPGSIPPPPPPPPRKAPPAPVAAPPAVGEEPPEPAPAPAVDEAPVAAEPRPAGAEAPVAAEPLPGEQAPAGEDPAPEAAAAPGPASSEELAAAATEAPSPGDERRSDDHGEDAVLVEELG